MNTCIIIIFRAPLYRSPTVFFPPSMCLSEISCPDHILYPIGPNLDHTSPTESLWEKSFCSDLKPCVFVKKCRSSQKCMNNSSLGKIFSSLGLIWLILHAQNAGGHRWAHTSNKQSFQENILQLP